VRVSFELPDGTPGHGALLSTAVAPRKRRCFYIRLNPDFVQPALLRDHQFRIAIERRRQLNGMLSQWLHDFLSTHAPGVYLSVGYLRDLSGYRGLKKKFVSRLEEALTELARGAPTLLRDFEIERRGKDSDGWVVRMSRGEERPEFTMPEALQRVERSVGVQRLGEAPQRRKSVSAIRGRVAL
jgi:hypothetical protein